MFELNGISLALDLATRKRDQMAISATKAASALDRASEQMGQLQRYADETDQRWFSGGATVSSVELIKHHFQFVERLQHAIGLQGETLKSLEGALENSRQSLLTSEIQVKTLKKLLDSRMLTLELKNRRFEQRQMDEMASNQFMRTKRQLSQEQQNEY